LVKVCLRKALRSLQVPYKLMLILTVPSVRVTSHPIRGCFEPLDTDHETDQRPPRPLPCTVLTFLLSMAVREWWESLGWCWWWSR
jgi:hypothetical protein